MKKLGLLVTVIAAVAFSAAPALSGVVKKKTEDFTIGTTKIQWTSSFVADGFETIFGIDDIVVIPLKWSVFPVNLGSGDFTGGVADFVGVSLDKKFGSKGVTGDFLFPHLHHGFPGPHVPHGLTCDGGACDRVDDTVVELDVAVHFHGLKCGGGGVGKGKVHLKLFLFIDAVLELDMGGMETLEPDTVAGYGFNLNVKTPPGSPLCL